MGFLRAARSAPSSGDRSGQTFRAWLGQVEKANSPSPVRDKTAHTVFGASVFFDAPLPWGCNGARSESPCQARFVLQPKNIFNFFGCSTKHSLRKTRNNKAVVQKEFVLRIALLFKRGVKSVSRLELVHLCVTETH